MQPAAEACAVGERVRADCDVR